VIRVSGIFSAQSLTIARVRFSDYRTRMTECNQRLSIRMAAIRRDDETLRNR
jgi:hypothetical protein